MKRKMLATIIVIIWICVVTLPLSSAKRVEEDLQQPIIIRSDISDPNKWKTDLQKLKDIDNPKILISIHGIKDTAESLEDISDAISKQSDHNVIVLFEYRRGYLDDVRWKSTTANGGKFLAETIAEIYRETGVKPDIFAYSEGTVVTNKMAMLAQEKEFGWPKKVKVDEKTHGDVKVGTVILVGSPIKENENLNDLKTISEAVHHFWSPKDLRFFTRHKLNDLDKNSKKVPDVSHTKWKNPNTMYDIDSKVKLVDIYAKLYNLESITEIPTPFGTDAPTYDLKSRTAVEQGICDVQGYGTGNYHSLTVKIYSKHKDTHYLSLDGAYFIPSDPHDQRMETCMVSYSPPHTKLLINATDYHNWKTFKVESFCLDASGGIPKLNESYYLSKNDTACLNPYLDDVIYEYWYSQAYEGGNYSHGTAQGAVWYCTEDYKYWSSLSKDEQALIKEATGVNDPKNNLAWPEAIVMGICLLAVACLFRRVV